MGYSSYSAKSNSLLAAIDEDLISRGNELEIPLSISYGIAKYEGKIDKNIFEKIFKEADEEMYRNKAMKKNTISILSPKIYIKSNNT